MWLGAAPRVTLTVGKDLVVTLRRGAVKHAQAVAQYDSPIPAPVAKGSVVGALLVSAPDLPTRQVPLVAATSVGRMDAFGRIATLAGYLIWGRH